MPSFYVSLNTIIKHWIQGNLAGRRHCCPFWQPPCTSRWSVPGGPERLWDGPCVSEKFWHLAGRPLGRPLRFGNISEFGGPPFGTAPTFRDFNGHLLGCPYTNYFTSMRWASATFFGSSFGRVTVRTPSLKAAWMPSFWMLRTVN